MILPWQIQQWQQLWRAKASHRLPHALLFSGPSGTGKSLFAESFARTLLCQNVTSEGGYCNTCHACRLIAGGAHPNVLSIAPEKEGSAIKIDQVRAVSDFVNQSSLQGEYRIVLIHKADAMNANAANALLKTLEEPSRGAIIILISSQFSHLPATILSRCQRILFPKPKTESAREWLKKEIADNTINLELLMQLAHGAPLHVLRFVNDGMHSVRQMIFNALYSLSKKESHPIKSAALMQDVDALTFIDFNLSWIMDLLRLQLCEDADVLSNQDYTNVFQEIKTKTHLSENTQLMAYLQQLRGEISTGINLNKQLMMEDVLFRWVMCHLG